MSTNVPLAYLNGSLVPQSDARLPLHDAGFIMGATATDLCRTFGHRLYRLADHLSRFRRSCDAARIPQPLADTTLTRLAEELVAHNAALLASDDDLILVFFATPGPVGYYGGLPGGLGDGPPTLGMHTFPLPFWRYQRLFRKGASLVIPAVRHVAAASVDPRIKQRSRLHWWLADREAQESEPGSIALLLNLAGQVTETAGANFLLVRAGTVVSPPAETILGGISLMAVKELCADLGIAFEERPISAADCHTADEALLASTPYCLAGVRQIDGHPIPWPGTLWQRLLAAWSGRAGIDIAGQILRHR